MAADWVVEWNSALREQHALLFDPQKRGIRDEYAEFPRCPVCGRRESSVYCVKDWFRYVRCDECSMVYLNPRLNEAATHQFYNSRANEIYNKSKFDTESAAHETDDRANVANLDWLDSHRGARGGDLLEIGSAQGYFLKEARARGYRVHGLELNETNWRRSRDALGDTILNVDLAAARYPAESFDVIYMRDLIAHLPDPAGFMRECWRIAKPGALILVDTHNIESFINRMTRGDHTVMFGFMEPHHWSPKTLGRLLAATGFRIRDVQFQSLDATVGEVLGYRAYPSFTRIFPPKRPRAWSWILRRAHSLLSRPPFSSLDRRITPAIVHSLRLGSVMRVLAEKPPRQ